MGGYPDAIDLGWQFDGEERHQRDLALLGKDPPMPRLFVRHDVEDYDTWKAAYDAFDAERQSMGVTGHAVYRSVDDGNDVTAYHDFETLEAAQHFASSARLREVMAQAGVSSEPQIWFVEEA
jgi:hypothetical protein